VTDGAGLTADDAELVTGVGLTADDAEQVTDVGPTADDAELTADGAGTIADGAETIADGAGTIASGACSTAEGLRSATAAPIATGSVDGGRGRNRAVCFRLDGPIVMLGSDFGARFGAYFVDKGAPRGLPSTSLRA
jgi:X-X-X-Leu-X-X-Gly heptad repeat protein